MKDIEVEEVCGGECALDQAGIWVAPEVSVCGVRQEDNREDNEGNIVIVGSDPVVSFTQDLLIGSRTFKIY
ncbi:MAG: hypothetical protein BWY45_02198 [Euryarchaeota archaeon ADurb.Bin294]|nr:MAG: hypothetical protein BWY45_02198 [Euryarchaeota archaeon ADurb.Bin294]